MRQQDIAEFCEYTLQKMDSFDIDRYFDMLRMRGYEVNPRYDTTNCKLVGYTIGKNASVFKASAIGRKFMVSQLEATWKKMHPKPTQVKIATCFTFRFTGSPCSPCCSDNETYPVQF